MSLLENCYSDVTMQLLRNKQVSELPTTATELKQPLLLTSPKGTSKKETSALVWGLLEAKYLVCLLLVFQNTGAVILMRYTRSMPGEGSFNTQTAVLTQEAMKGFVCILLLFKDHGTVSSAWEKPAEALKTSVPALLYLVQNNLQYVAVSHLDAATYTVSYQTKIVWSGLLSVLLLNRRLSLHKWLAIALLGAGVAAVQVAGELETKKVSIFGLDPQRATGMSAVIAAAVVSAMAGVYFEKILKGARVGLWTRNLQLAFYSVLIGYAKLATSPEGKTLTSSTFFNGYTKLTWLCIFTNAFGGLLVGCTIRYADAVMKDVALGLSIVLSSMISTLLFDFRLSVLFAAGIAAVIYAAVLYGERAHCCGLLLLADNQVSDSSQKDSPTSDDLDIKDNNSSSLDNKKHTMPV